MKRILLGAVIGAAVVLCIGYLISTFTAKKDNSTSDYYLIENQIKNLNKMVVVEQDFSTVDRTRFDYTFLGQKVSDNTIVTVTKTQAQVSYDLNQLKVKIDSTNKKLIIESVPKADIRIIPSVEIKSMDDSFVNRIDEKDIKQVTEQAKTNAIKTVNKTALEERGKKQLLQNLNQIFVLAKTLNYQIVDKTQSLNTSGL